MLRLLAAALAATLAYPACAETGFAEAAGLPLGRASAGPDRRACELLAQPAADRGSAMPVRPAMTLSPRMLEAIRVEAEMPAD